MPDVSDVGSLTPAACLFRGLGDPTRLAILGHLAVGELRVRDLTDRLELAQSTVSAHLACLRDFNDGVLCMRSLEQRIGSSGRYEWEFRLQREPQAQESVAWLDRFTALARTNNVDPDAVFAALGGRPVLEPWSPAATSWQRA